MKSIILVTGASTGFGHLTARTLAHAGHTVYASMRDIAGRNAFRVQGAEEVTAVAERARLDFAHRIGIDDLLHPVVSRRGA